MTRTYGSSLCGSHPTMKKNNSMINTWDLKKSTIVCFIINNITVGFDWIFLALNYPPYGQLTRYGEGTGTSKQQNRRLSIG